MRDASKDTNGPQISAAGQMILILSSIAAFACTIVLLSFTLPSNDSKIFEEFATGGVPTNPQWSIEPSDSAIQNAPGIDRSYQNWMQFDENIKLRKNGKMLQQFAGRSGNFLETNEGQARRGIKIDNNQTRNVAQVAHRIDKKLESRIVIAYNAIFRLMQDIRLISSKELALYYLTIQNDRIFKKNIHHDKSTKKIRAQLISDIANVKKSLGARMENLPDNALDDFRALMDEYENYSLGVNHNLHLISEKGLSRKKSLSGQKARPRPGSADSSDLRDQNYLRILTEYVFLVEQTYLFEQQHVAMISQTSDGSHKEWHPGNQLVFVDWMLEYYSFIRPSLDMKTINICDGLVDQDHKNFEKSSQAFHKNQKLLSLRRFNDGAHQYLMDQMLMGSNPDDIRAQLDIVSELVNPLNSAAANLIKIEKKSFDQIRKLRLSNSLEMKDSCLNREVFNRFLVLITKHAMAEELRGMYRQRHFDASHRIVVAMR